MSLLGPFVKMSRALKERGLKGAITQLYVVGSNYIVSQLASSIFSPTPSCFCRLETSSLVSWRELISLATNILRYNPFHVTLCAVFFISCLSHLLSEPGFTVWPAQMGWIQEHPQLWLNNDSAWVSQIMSRLERPFFLPTKGTSLLSTFRWHGWMHHVYDETPNDPVAVPDYLASSTISHAIYNTHVGRVSASAANNDREQLDTTQYR